MDRSIADKTSAAADRQRAYYDGWDVDIIIIAKGDPQIVDLAPGLKVHVSGGTTKFSALMKGRRLARCLAKEKHPDVVTAQDPLWSGRVASSAACASGAALHIQDHSGFFARKPFGMMEKCLAPSARRIARRADRIRTVSERGARGLENIGVDEKRIDIIPIATDLRIFNVSGDANYEKFKVLCVARLEPEKGVDVLLKAWKEITDDYLNDKNSPKPYLRIIGDGSLRKKLEKKVNELGIDEFVGFKGKQNHESVYAEIADSSIVVQPSYFEGWGLSVIEAAAAGRPVVMTDVGAAGEIIVDKVSGRVVHVGDISAFAQAIRDVFTDVLERDKYIKEAKLRVQKLPTPEQTVDLIRQSFEKTAH